MRSEKLHVSQVSCNAVAVGPQTVDHLLKNTGLQKQSGSARGKEPFL